MDEKRYNELVERKKRLYNQIHFSLREEGGRPGSFEDFLRGDWPHLVDRVHQVCVAAPLLVRDRPKHVHLAKEVKEWPGKVGGLEILLGLVSGRRLS
jgi:hypothetical protein